MCEPERPGGYGICPRTPDGCGEFEAWLYRDPRSGWSLAFGHESECMSVEAVDGRRWWLAMGAGRFGSDMAAVPVEYCPWCGRRLDDEGGGAE